MRFKVWGFGFLAVSILAAPAASVEFSGNYHTGSAHCCQHTLMKDLSNPACCGVAYGLVPGCCEFSPSWADRIWDGYCQQKRMPMGWGRCHKSCGHRAGGACRSHCGTCTAVCGKKF